MKKILIILALLLSGATGYAQKGKLLWAEEFDYKGMPDSTRWKYDLGDGCPDVCGWGNNELQYYTSNPENVYVKKGMLVIEALKTDKDQPKFTSTRLVSKQDWQYGYIEVRAKLPKAVGTWPAIWMLPTQWKYGGWPASGEIDIMEHVGYDPGVVHGTVHTAAFNHGIGTQKGKQIQVEKFDRRFHRYAIRWTADKIEFFVDDKLYNTFAHTGGDYKEWPFDQPFHLLLNVAVGGNWGGKEGVDDNAFPQRMEVDYVRVYALD
ncbi:glycoside hydrolase family 16 protein [Cesiribacter sp. SM1]|uniref:glycoside hydrolase family 16 protein n=1 Tax=Cesiribacter sp. SM1 TaxID=2861196 RepID=UPI001CD2B1CD|nr:glycoside hydrolase family 16 protein [Cesiribacter sp. SM1]